MLRIGLFLFGSLLFWAESGFASERLVFMSETESGKQIVVARGDGTRPVPLTHGQLWHLYPDIDASGRYVAYLEGPTASDLQVLVWDSEERHFEHWTKGARPRFHPRFSRDGRFLAYAEVGTDGTSVIQVLNLEKARASGPVKTDASLSPAHLYFEAATLKVPGEYSAYFPALASDGSFVVFQRNLSTVNKDIALYDFSTQKTVSLTGSVGRAMAPALSQDDRLVAYTKLLREEQGTNGNASGRENWEIFILDRISGESFRVTRSPGNDHAPAFRADGSLVFASNRTGKYQIHEIPAEEITKKTFGVRLLVSAEADLYAPRLSGQVKYSQGRLADIPEPARSSFGAARVGDKFYVLGGHQGKEHTYPPESFLDRVEVYDLKTGQWSSAAPRPSPCHGYQAVAYGKYIYAFGGFAYSESDKPKWKSLDVIDRFDTEKNGWVRLSGKDQKLLEPRSSNVAARVGDKVYLIAGWDSRGKGKFHRTIEVFDLKTETISLAPFTLPDPLRRALSSVTVGEEVLLVGGLGEGETHFELMDKVTALNVRTGKSHELPKLPFATFAPATGRLGDSLFVFGGMFKVGPKDYTYVNHIYELRAGGKAWENTGRHLKEAKGFSMVLPLSKDSLGVLGGHSYDGNTDSPVKTFETFGY